MNQHNARPVAHLLTALLISVTILNPTSVSAANVSRSCDYTLYINGGIAKTGSGTGSAGTVYLARRNAAKNILDCFNKAANSPNSTVYCSNVSGGGFGKPISKISPYIIELHSTNIQVRGDNGCFGKASKNY